MDQSQLKEAIKAARLGLSEVKKRQTAIINYALIRLEDLGK